MTQEKIDRFFQRNGYYAVKDFIDTCDDDEEVAGEYEGEYNLLVSVIDEDWEYGYGDYTFRYDSVEQFVKECQNDVEGWGEIEDIMNLVLEVVFIDEDGEELDRIEIDEI